MRISRIFTPQELHAEERLILEGAPAHYLGRVLRMSPGQELIVFNGKGDEYSARIEEIGKKQVILSLGARRESKTESPLLTHLGLGLSRGERMDYAIQKSTELGVTELTPLFTEHSEVRLKPDRAAKRQQHWQQIAISACEQSGRLQPPLIHPPMTLPDWINNLEVDIRLLCYQGGKDKHHLPQKPESLALLIGPEGGFSDGEISLCEAESFKALKLGPRILRTETAPVAALTLVQFLWGDLGADLK